MHLGISMSNLGLSMRVAAGLGIIFPVFDEKNDLKKINTQKISS
jgi:hypothetical protein